MGHFNHAERTLAKRSIELQLTERIYRAQFYYRGYKPYDSGNKDFDDINDFLVTMLQIHADHETVKNEESTS